MSHADISGHKTAGDVTAFAKYNRLVIALPASKLAQSNDEAVVHGSFYAQMGTVPIVTHYGDLLDCNLNIDHLGSSLVVCISCCFHSHFNCVGSLLGSLLNGDGPGL